MEKRRDQLSRVREKRMGSCRWESLVNGEIRVKQARVGHVVATESNRHQVICTTPRRSS